MLSEFFDFIWGVCWSALNMMNSSSVWMCTSFLIAGALHEFLNPETMRRSSIGTTRISGVLSTTVMGMFIPICSCGTIPLGISLYYSGACLGPTLAFMTSTPMINPVAVILSWGLLGKEITIIYIITGFAAPMIIGMVANKFGGKELYAPGCSPEETSPAIQLEGDDDEEESSFSGPAIQLEEEKMGFWERLRSGLKWSLTDLAVTVSKYAVGGMLIAGLLFNVVPQSAIQTYLGNPGFVSLLGITVVAALMYVCAVGHIPFIAALVASGAAPGVAITFLMAGASTNIPELLTITKTMGKRSMLMYFGMVTIISNIVGYLTNHLLMPGFVPVMDYDATHKTITTANKLITVAPVWLKYVCSFILIGYAAYALIRKARPSLGRRAA